MLYLQGLRDSSRVSLKSGETGVNCCFSGISIGVLDCTVAICGLCISSKSSSNCDDHDGELEKPQGTICLTKFLSAIRGTLASLSSRSTLTLRLPVFMAIPMGESIRVANGLGDIDSEELSLNPSGKILALSFCSSGEFVLDGELERPNASTRSKFVLVGVSSIDILQNCRSTFSTY